MLSSFRGGAWTAIEWNQFNDPLQRVMSRSSSLKSDGASSNFCRARAEFACLQLMPQCFTWALVKIRGWVKTSIIVRMKMKNKICVYIYIYIYASWKLISVFRNHYKNIQNSSQASSRHPSSINKTSSKHHQTSLNNTKTSPKHHPNITKISVKHHPTHHQNITKISSKTSSKHHQNITNIVFVVVWV